MEEFKELSLRTLSGCLEMIDIRNHNDFVTKAKIAGVGEKLEFKQVQRKIQELSKENLKLMEQAHKDAIKRKFEERNKKNE